MIWSCPSPQLHLSLHIPYLFHSNHTPISAFVDTAPTNTSPRVMWYNICTITCSDLASGHWCPPFLALFSLISEWSDSGQTSDGIWLPTVCPFSSFLCALEGWPPLLAPPRLPYLWILLECPDTKNCWKAEEQEDRGQGITHSLPPQGLPCQATL